MSVNTAAIASDLHQIEKSIGVLQELGSDSSQWEELLRQKDLVLGNPNPESMEIYKRKATLLLGELLVQGRPEVHLRYLLQALCQDNTRLEEVIALIQKYELESYFTQQDVREMLSNISEDHAVTKEPYFSVFKKMDSDVLFKLRYVCNIREYCIGPVEQYQDREKILSEDVLDFENNNKNLIDTNLIKKRLKKLRGDVSIVDIEKVIREILKRPGGEGFIKTCVADSTISLLHSTTAYNFLVIYLFSPEERLSWFKENTRNNIIPHLVFSEKKGLHTLLGTENEILNFEQIKELYSHISSDSSASFELKEIPTSVLEALKIA